jgi:hypothetical protein
VLGDRFRIFVTALSGVVPPFIAEPSDFSKMLAMPPAWLPATTTPFIWPLWPLEHSFHHSSRSSSLRPTCSETARRVSMFSTQ